jgi:hypothetical protein
VGDLLKEYTSSGSLSASEAKYCDNDLKQIEGKIKILVDQAKRTPEGLVLNLGDKLQELGATGKLIGRMLQLRDRMLALAAKKNGQSAASTLKDELIEGKLKGLQDRLDRSRESNSIVPSEYNYFQTEIKRLNGVMKTLASQARTTTTGPQMNVASRLAVHSQIDGLNAKLNEMLARRPK